MECHYYTNPQQKKPKKSKKNYKKLQKIEATAPQPKNNLNPNFFKLTSIYLAFRYLIIIQMLSEILWIYSKFVPQKYQLLLIEPGFAHTS